MNGSNKKRVKNPHGEGEMYDTSSVSLGEYPPEFRYDPLENIWVIVAPERNKRPLLIGEKQIKDSQEECPFCPGKESETPPEIWRLPEEKLEHGNKSSTWKIRVIPNKYPALRNDLAGKWFENGLYEFIQGVGVHEAFIETPDHNIDFEDLPYEHILDVLKTYRFRVKTLYRNPKIKYALLFKNQGSRAGASMKHPHSQLIGTPVLPKGVAAKLKTSLDYRRQTSRCLICDLLKKEKEERSRLVISKKGITAFVPYAARFPYEVFIVPEDHCPCFTQAEDDTLAALAEVLKEVLTRLKSLLKEPPYNMILNTAPNPEFKIEAWPGNKENHFFLDFSDKNFDYYHWHVNIFPRLTPIAAFEWGSGFSINPMLPEVCAEALRRK